MFFSFLVRSTKKKVDIFARVSFEHLDPSRDPAVGKILYSGFKLSI